MSLSFSSLSIETIVSIELDDSQNPNMAESAKRPREELNEDDDSQSPNLAQSAKRPINDDDEICTQAAGTGKSTCVHPVKEPIIDDGSTGGVLQHKEDEGSVGEEDIYTDDDLGEEDNASVDTYESDKYEFMWCESCVDNEVCKECGYKDGFPPDYKIPPILEKCECFRCGGDDTYSSADCLYSESRMKKCNEAFEEWKKLMRSRGTM